MVTNSPSSSSASLPDPIYLDFASSTPLDQRVLEAMLPYYISYYGNPAARLHQMGALADEALSEARQFFASLFHADFQQTIFLSSATEANNLVLRGLVTHPRRKRHRIVYAATEHSSIIETALALQRLDASLEVVPLAVDQHGQIDLDKATALIDDHTLCVCVMDVNNETGILQTQLGAVVSLANRFGVHVHVDAVQGFARSQLESAHLGYDSLVVSSGKIYGPKGAAALALRPTYGRLRIEPQLTGGGQEFGWRSSTVNVPAVVGFAKAAQLQVAACNERLAHYKKCEQDFLASLEKHHLGALVHGHTASRAPGILSLAFPNINAMKLVESVPNLCVSVGSACRTLQATASHVLVAMGVELDQALASLRISFGTTTHPQELSRGAALLADAIGKMSSKK